MFLTHHADQLMNLNRTYACEKNCCEPCQLPYDVGTMMPSESSVYCNSQTCGPMVADISGIGQMPLQTNQPLVCPGINNPQKPKNCCTPPKNNFDYYPDDETMGTMGVQRTASPGGGIPLNGGDPEYYK